MNDSEANSPDQGTLPEKNGEHPYGDAGQLILLGLFLVIWLGDSFLVHSSTFLANYVPLVLRLIILGLALVAAFALVKAGHVVVSHEERPITLVGTGAFHYVRHPLSLLPGTGISSQDWTPPWIRGSGG